MAAEGFESFHVPQQSRRDKLRVLPLNNPSSTTTCDDETLHGCPPALLSFYDPSLLHSHMLSTIPDPCKQPACINSPSSSVKEEGANNLLAYVGGSMNSSSSSSQLHHHHPHPYLNPHTTHPSNLNPNHQIQDINGANPFLYNFRDFDHHHHQSFSGGGSADVVTFKPQALSLANNESRVTAQGLSLSLSSHHQNLSYNAMFDAKATTSPIGGGGGYAAVRGIVPCGSSGGGASTSNDVRSLVPLGPFTGYASILKGSRFLKPAQQLLEDLCDVGRGIYVERRTCGDSSLMDPSVETLTSASGIGLGESLACSTTDHRGHDHRRRKMRLISLLEEVYRRYKLYYQQMQTIVSSFESVAGLGNAAPYASFALKAMSKHFKCLKNSITDQLNFTSKALGDGSFRKNEATAYGNTDQWVHSHRTIQNPGILEHQPVWRPQRGLPERAVAVLRAWLFEHFLHPYPTDTDKQMLAKQTGLSRSQVSNWFINARVRLWKPMVEEIHMLETRQAQKPSDEDQNSCKPHESSLPTVNSPLSDKQVQSNPQHKAEDHSIKQIRNEVPNVPNMGNEPMNFSYNNLSSREHVGGGVSGTGGNSGVSLTLGLRQNNGIGLSDRFPMNIARRFGVDPSNEGYIVSGFEGSNRQFGKDIGGHLLHDFVG